MKLYLHKENVVYIVYFDLFPFAPETFYQYEDLTAHILEYQFEREDKQGRPHYQYIRKQLNTLAPYQIR